MIVRVAEGKVVAAWLARRNDRGRVIAAAEGLDHEGAWRSLAAALDREVAAIRGQGATVDSPMRWVRSPRLSTDDHRTFYSDRFYPRRYSWSPRHARWFLLREHQQTRWDSRPLEATDKAAGEDRSADGDPTTATSTPVGLCSSRPRPP